MQAPQTWNYQRLAEVFHAQGLAMPKASMETLSMPVITQFLRSGQFIAAMPKSVVHFNLLKVLPVDFPARPWPVNIVTLRNRTLSPVVFRFIECAREVVKSIPGKPGCHSGRRRNPESAEGHVRLRRSLDRHVRRSSNSWRLYCTAQIGSPGPFSDTPCPRHEMPIRPSSPVTTKLARPAEVPVHSGWRPLARLPSGLVPHPSLSARFDAPAAAIERQSRGGLRVVLLVSDGDPEPIRTPLLNFPDSSIPEQ